MSNHESRRVFFYSFEKCKKLVGEEAKMCYSTQLKSSATSVNKKCKFWAIKTVFINVSYFAFLPFEKKNQRKPPLSYVVNVNRVTKGNLLLL